MREANLPPMGERLQRLQDDLTDVTLERMVLIEPALARTQPVEEARPERARVAQEDSECRRPSEVRELKCVADGAVVPGDLKGLHEIDPGWRTPKPEIGDQALPGRLHAPDHGMLRCSLPRAPPIVRCCAERDVPHGQSTMRSNIPPSRILVIHSSAPQSSSS